MTDQEKGPDAAAGSIEAPVKEGEVIGNVPGTDVFDNSERSLEFLRRFAPEGPWALVAIDPEKKTSPEGATFAAGEQEACRAWIDAWNGRRNLYFHVNSLLRTPKQKASKADIAALDWLHVDCDPRAGENLREERERIEAMITADSPKGLPRPTCVVFTGGGYQAFWRLRNPLPIEGDERKAEDAERYNVAIARLLGGDNCHNADRVMRLPGTLNIPTPTKLKQGRTVELARVVDFNDNAYDIAQFTPAPAATPAGSDEKRSVEIDTSSIERVTDVSALDEYSVPDRVKVAIVQGKHPDEPLKGDNSRSAWLFFVCCNLVRCGVPDEMIYAIITDRGFGISESVVELGGRKADRYARRQIGRAKERAEEFATDKDGRPLPTIRNLNIALARTGVAVRRNEFSGRYTVYGLDGYGPEYNDNAERALRVGIEERFGLRYGRERFEDLVLWTADEDSFHPVKDYLAGLRWDGEQRAETWLVDLAGAEDSAFVRAVSRIFLVAAVRRIMRPGAKYDELLVLEGEQGGNKSSALKRLAVEEDWFTDNLPLTGDSKVAVEQTQGKWIVEAAELKGKARDHDALKNFLSMASDRARLSYGRLAQDFPRQWVPIGTTNKGQYLHDPTGNRRFWPVAVEKFDLARMTREYVDQLWAEAAALEASGASIRLDPALYAAAAGEQAKREEDDPWQEIVADRVRDAGGEDRGCRVTAQALWDFVGVETDRRTQEQNRRLGAIMRKLGFARKQFRMSGKVVHGYVRGDGEKLVASLGGRRDDEVPF